MRRCTLYSKFQHQEFLRLKDIRSFYSTVSTTGLSRRGLWDSSTCLAKQKSRLISELLHSSIYITGRLRVTEVEGAFKKAIVLISTSITHLNPRHRSSQNSLEEFLTTTVPTDYLLHFLFTLHNSIWNSLGSYQSYSKSPVFIHL